MYVSVSDCVKYSLLTLQVPVSQMAILCLVLPSHQQTQCWLQCKTVFFEVSCHQRFVTILSWPDDGIQIGQSSLTISHDISGCLAALWYFLVIVLHCSVCLSLSTSWIKECLVRASVLVVWQWGNGAADSAAGEMTDVHVNNGQGQPRDGQGHDGYTHRTLEGVVLMSKVTWRRGPSSLPPSGRFMSVGGFEGILAGGWSWRLL